MNTKIQETIENNFINDLRKPEIGKFEKALILRTIIDRQQESLRSFAKKHNIPTTTLYGWLLFNKISEEEYNTKLQQGKTHTQIYNELRKTEKPKKLNEIETTKELIQEINKRIKNIRIKRTYECTQETEELIKTLINELNQILVQIELSDKKTKLKY